MNKGNLFSGHPAGNQLLPDILIDRKCRLCISQRHCLLQRVKDRIVHRLGRLFGRGCLGRRDIAEHQLGQLVGLAILPDLHDVVHALVDLGAGFVRQQLVDDPLVQSQLAAIAGVG